MPLLRLAAPVGWLSMVDADLHNFIERLDSFSMLPEEFGRALATEVRVQSYKAKSLVFLEGDPAQAGYILVTGRIALKKCSPNGKELIVDLISPGGPFGVFAFLDHDDYPLSDYAQIESKVLCLANESAHALMHRFPGFQRALLNVVRDRLHTAHNLARAIAHDNAETRVAALLTTLFPRLTDDDRRPEIVISRQELAELAAMTLETASRVTKGFEREGILDASSPGVLRILDTKRLLQFAQA